MVTMFCFSCKRVVQVTKNEECSECKSHNLSPIWPQKAIKRTKKEKNNKGEHKNRKKKTKVPSKKQKWIWQLQRRKS